MPNSRDYARVKSFFFIWSWIKVRARRKGSPVLLTVRSVLCHMVPVDVKPSSPIRPHERAGREPSQGPELLRGLSPRHRSSRYRQPAGGRFLRSSPATGSSPLPGVIMIVCVAVVGHQVRTFTAPLDPRVRSCRSGLMRSRPARCWNYWLRTSPLRFRRCCRTIRCTCRASRRRTTPSSSTTSSTAPSTSSTSEVAKRLSPACAPRRGIVIQIYMAFFLAGCE